MTTKICILQTIVQLLLIKKSLKGSKFRARLRTHTCVRNYRSLSVRFLLNHKYAIKWPSGFLLLSSIGPAGGANIRGISDNHYGNDNDLRGLLDLNIVFTLMQLCTRGVKHGLQTYKIRCKPII